MTHLSPPSVVTDPRSWGPRAHCRDCRQLRKLESGFQVIRLVETSSKQLDWFLLLSGSWTGLRVFFAPWLGYTEREGPSESDQFQGLPFELSPSCSWSFHAE